jgi:hypothetical protein
MVISDNGRRGGLGGTFTVNDVIERGLRHAGAWPDDATRLAEQIIAALAEAAENEPEPVRRGRLQRAAGGVAGVGPATCSSSAGRRDRALCGQNS